MESRRTSAMYLGRRTARVSLVVLALGLVVIGASGCSIYVDSYAGYPAQTGPHDPLDEDANVYWSERGDRIAVVTHGSSSCPNEPRSIDLTSPTELVIEIKRSGGFLCTTDIATQTYEVPVPSGLDQTKRITVDLGPGTLRTLLPFQQ